MRDLNKLREKELLMLVNDIDKLEFIHPTLETIQSLEDSSFCRNCGKELILINGELTCKNCK